MSYSCTKQYIQRPSCFRPEAQLSPCNDSKTQGIDLYRYPPQNVFHYYKPHPQEGESVNRCLERVMAYQASWVSIYPHEKPVDTSVYNFPILVDVGGNIVYDVE